jgi:hypothetical protein
MKKRIIVVFHGHREDGKIEPMVDEDGCLVVFDDHAEAFEATRDHLLAVFVETAAVYV